MGPAILVLAPMPALPASAGNRRRLTATCEALARAGFSIDFAYYAHEDQIYRRFGQHPPTDFAAMAAVFRRVFVIEPRARIPLKTRARHFGIDEWCPDEVGDFVAWYVSQHPETAAILVNYVFLSRALERVPPSITRLIDTHDRFSGRRRQYRPFRAEPNFFYTDDTGEAAGLNRADIVLAIQADEARHFEAISTSRVLCLPPRFSARRAFAPVERIRRIGFIGHGNDPNRFSIDRFAAAWAEGWTGDRPELVIAGEICAVLAGFERPGVRLLGYLDRIEDFYESVDVVVAPMLMGSGLKMKVAEALSFGVPVVGTGIGFEGFETTDPAHRCRDAEAVMARILALAEDPAGLAALTAACEALFARYDEAAERAERELIGALRASGLRGAARVPEEPAAPGELPAVETRGAVRIACERSLRSLPAKDPDHGILVATETLPGGAPPYTPLRRRWFARAGEGDAPTQPIDGIGRVALAPEWVRGRTLPPPVRAALARAFSGIRPDWSAAGRVVDAADGCLELVLCLPAFLASGRHPAAIFLIPPDDGAASEWRIERVTPLRIRAGWPYADLSGRMPGPVPASLALRQEDGTAEARLREARGHLLLVTDDGIGRIDLADGDRACTS